MSNFHPSYFVALLVCLFILYLSWVSTPSLTNNVHDRLSPGISHSQDLAPSHQSINSSENGAPFIHCPHGSHRRIELLDKLKYLVASNMSSFCTCPEEVTFILVTNMFADKFPVSEQLYKLCGCRYVHIRLLENKTAWPGWQWSYKVSTEHARLAGPMAHLMFIKSYRTGILFIILLPT